MKSFFHVQDIGNLDAALKEAMEVKRTPFAWNHLGENKTIMLVFFNSSLRTRLTLSLFPHRKISRSGRLATTRCGGPSRLGSGLDSYNLKLQL